LSFVRELAIKPVEFAGEGFTDQCRDGVCQCAIAVALLGLRLQAEVPFARSQIPELIGR
jgi:hypothetical protein